MNFSIDTNVVFGVFNARDRLHDISIGLMKDKRNVHVPELLKRQRGTKIF